MEKFLRTVSKYSQHVITIETILDFEELTIEEVTKRPKMVDDRDEAPPTKLTVGGKLMYTEEQWLARQEKGGNDSSTCKEHHRRTCGGKKAKPKGDRDGGGQAEKVGTAADECKANHDNTYLNCNHVGHWAKDCPYPRRERGDAAHVTKAEEEAAPFLTHGFLELDAEQSSDKARALSFCTESATNPDIKEP